MNIRMCQYLHCGGLSVLVKQSWQYHCIPKRSLHTRSSLTCCGVSHDL